MNAQSKTGKEKTHEAISKESVEYVCEKEPNFAGFCFKTQFYEHCKTSLKLNVTY